MASPQLYSIVTVYLPFEVKNQWIKSCQRKNIMREYLLDNAIQEHKKRSLFIVLVTKKIYSRRRLKKTKKLGKLAKSQGISRFSRFFTFSILQKKNSK